jgi:hypothetical protein
VKATGKRDECERPGSDVEDENDDEGEYDWERRTTEEKRLASPHHCVIDAARPALPGLAGL